MCLITRRATEWIYARASRCVALGFVSLVIAVLALLAALRYGGFGLFVSAAILLFVAGRYFFVAWTIRR